MASIANAEGSAEAALWRLAERLYEKMEHLDPSGSEWNGLDDAGRRYYYFAIKAVLLEHGDVLRVIKVNLGDNNMINRCFVRLEKSNTDPR